MSKSIGNYIGVAEEPKQIFGKIMSIPDNLIVNYFKLCTDISEGRLKEIETQIALGSKNPMEFKKLLGETIILMYYSKNDAENARKEFESIFSKKEVPDDMPIIEISSTEFGENNEIYWPKFLADHGLAESSSRARGLIKQGGFTIDGNKQSDFATKLPFGGEHVLKVGKLRWAKLVIN